MPRTALTGTRIRERRALAGLKQADLARAVGISAAYLNLIEHNRRRVGDDLMAALADALGVAPKLLAEGAEGVLFEALREAAAEGVAEGGNPATGAQARRDGAIGPELDRIEEFVARFPGWAALLAGRQGRLATLERTVEALSDRMAHDPYLSASVHEVLSAVTSVRSTAAILAETEDIEPEWRARFHGNLAEDSERLTEAAGALVAYLDVSGPGDAALSSPQEEVEAWLASTDYHLSAIEAAGGPDAGAIVRGVPELATGAAQSLALRYVRAARTDAEALPEGALRAALAREGPDPARLAAATGQSMARVMRRLATLAPLEGARAFGLIICDASGTFTFRRPVEGFAFPRFGAACPLWPLFEALRQPMVPLRRHVETAGRLPRRFLTFSWCELASPEGFDGPQVAMAMMLITPEASPPQAGVARVVGATCRTCPRASCEARREPSILAEAR